MNKECMKQIILDAMKSIIDQLFYSEDDLKFKLAWQIKTLYPQLEIKFEVPSNILYFDREGKKIEKISYTDIVIKNNEGIEFPIEIKYKTKNIKVDNGIDIKEHGARDVSRYAIRRDIYRIEKQIESNKNIKKGYVLFFTNDFNYKERGEQKDANKEGTLDEHYRFYNDKIIKTDEGWNYKKWGKKDKNNRDEPENGKHWTKKGQYVLRYTLMKDYKIEWLPKPLPEPDKENNTRFIYFILEIDGN